jgi:hypothetical protein
MARVAALFFKQPHRMWCFAVVGDGTCLEVLLLERTSDTTYPDSVKRTGLLPFGWDGNSPGLRWLACLLSAPPARLGFKPSPPPDR